MQICSRCKEAVLKKIQSSLRTCLSFHFSYLEHFWVFPSAYHHATYPSNLFLGRSVHSDVTTGSTEHSHATEVAISSTKKQNIPPHFMETDN